LAQTTIEKLTARGETCVYHLCYLHTGIRGRREFEDKELAPILGHRIDHSPWASGPWRIFDYRQNKEEYFVAVYGRKLVICHGIRKSGSELHEVLKAFRKSDEFFLKYLEPKLRGLKGVRRILHYPILVVDQFDATPICIPKAQDRKLRFFDQYLTTFTFRVFDPDEVKVGYLRASVHQIVCLGLGKRIVQEIMGLVYEKLLYPWVLDPRAKRRERWSGRHHATVSDLFNLFDALKKYTLSTELTVFAAHFSSRLAIYLAMLAVVATLAGALLPTIGIPVGWAVPLLFALLGIVTATSWVLLRKYLRIRVFV
jgi:hypothetical protein